MPALSQERELDLLLADSRPETRFVDLCIVFRRLTISSPVPIPDDTLLLSAAGVEMKCRSILSSAGSTLITASATPGASRVLSDGEQLRWAGGVATLRAEVVATFGRRWDRALKTWSPDPVEAPLVFDLMESQVLMTRTFAARWAYFKRGQRHPKHSYFVVDDRAGGKSLVCLLLVLAAKIDYPTHPDGADVVVWIVTVTHKARKQLEREIRKWLPADWYRFHGTDFTLTLAHGGAIQLQSTDDPDSLKDGRVDLAMLDELAKMSSEPYENGFPRTRDRKGFFVMPSNPPVRQRGSWIAEVAEKAEEAAATGSRNPVDFIACNSRLNVLIDTESTADVTTVLRWISPARADADGEGLIRPVGDRLYRPPYSSAKHYIPYSPSTWDHQDITRLVCKQEAGMEADWIVVADFQLRPGCVGIRAKIFGSRERPVFWIFGDYWSEGSEDDMIDEMEFAEPGGDPIVTPKNTLVVADCSGDTQNFDHRPGKDSFSPFRARGYKIVACNRPARSSTTGRAKNPPVDRTLMRVHTALKEDRFFIDKAAEQTAVSLRDCKYKRSITRIYAIGTEAHLGDCCRYLVWWATPPRRPAGATKPRIWSAGRR